jgi:inner membrane protein
MALAPRQVPACFWSLAVACAIIADVDLIGFLLGVPYDHFFGHRGFFHSLFFALLVTIFLIAFWLRDADRFSRRWYFYFGFFFLLSASHGILDAFTQGSIGVALLSPFDSTRYFFPWTPLSMVRTRVFLRTWSFAAIRNELLYIWLPALLIIVVARLIRGAAPKPAGPA